MKIEDLKKYEETELLSSCYKTSEIKCPYCGYEFSDSWEAVRQEQDNREIVGCKNCEKSFYTYVQIEVEYTSEPLENVIVEDYKCWKERFEEYDYEGNDEYTKDLCLYYKKELDKTIELFEEYKEQFENREEN